MDDLTVDSYIQGQAGVTHTIHMESCLLHVNARPSIWKPLFKALQLTLGMSYHQHSSPMKREKKKKTFKWKVSAPGALRVKQLHTICSLSTPSISASHIMIKSESNIYSDLNGAVISRNIQFLNSSTEVRK